MCWASEVACAKAPPSIAGRISRPKGRAVTSVNPRALLSPARIARVRKEPRKVASPRGPAGRTSSKPPPDPSGPKGSRVLLRGLSKGNGCQNTRIAGARKACSVGPQLSARGRESEEVRPHQAPQNPQGVPRRAAARPLSSTGKSSCGNSGSRNQWVQALRKSGTN